MSGEESEGEGGEGGGEEGSLAAQQLQLEAEKEALLHNTGLMLEVRPPVIPLLLQYHVLSLYTHHMYYCCKSRRESIWWLRYNREWTG